MTEQSYQQCRKLMQKINYARGQITKQKGEVARWTQIEAIHRQELREGQANGAKKMLERAMKKLDEFRDKFAAISFPDSNIQKTYKANSCNACKAPLAQGETVCGLCLNDNTSK